MKAFIRCNQSRNDAIKLAHKIHTAGFVPDVIYVSLRGGAYLGNVISEYFKLVRGNERPVFYAAVVAHSYKGIHEQEEIRIDGWTYDPQHLRHGDKVLIVDDIFDSGRTMNHLLAIIESQGVPRANIKIAVQDYKVRTFEPASLVVPPDYYCHKIEVNTPAEDVWVHYLTHELVGLTPDEVETYYSDDPEVREILANLGI